MNSPCLNPDNRHGNLLFKMLVAMVVVTAILGFALWRGASGPVDNENRPLVMHTAAGTRAAVEDVVSRYEEEYGVKVELQFGGSNSLLNQLQVNKFDTADLYLAADDFYTDKAVALDLAREVIPVAYQRPVLAFRKDSKREFDSIEDLLDGETSISMGNPEQAAIGRAIRNSLSEEQPNDQPTLWERLEKQIEDKGVFKPTVNEVANDIKIGAVEAGIVWDSTVSMPNYRDELEFVAFPELDTGVNQICVSILNSSERPTAALKFARFLSAQNRGLTSFKEFGMRPVEGDEWSETPEITFFCGAVNRRSMEPILDDFQAREGCTIKTIYDGCGILTSRMKTVKDQDTVQGFPDVYLACDRFYLDNVSSWFENDVDVSETELVIAVPKGSKTVTSLEDLVKPGIRVAIGEPSQCTVGALTKRLLQRENLFEKMVQKKADRSEVVAEKSSSAHLIPDVTTGNVDAAIAYLTDVKANLDSVDYLPIDSALNKAIQPFSIAKTSQHKELAKRLLEHIARSEKEFQEAGFEFKLGGVDVRELVSPEPGS